MSKSEILRIQIPIPSSLNEEIKTRVAEGRYASKAEFIRDACRKALDVAK
jgi:Arc/MetJ-type ribon-helix-helix transcriptional regulator